MIDFDKAFDEAMAKVAPNHPPPPDVRAAFRKFFYIGAMQGSVATMKAITTESDAEMEDILRQLRDQFAAFADDLRPGAGAEAIAVGEALSEAMKAGKLN